MPANPSSENSAVRLPVIPFRASREEHERWKRVAEARGLSFSAFARRALNAAADVYGDRGEVRSDGLF